MIGDTPFVRFKPSVGAAGLGFWAGLFPCAGCPCANITNSSAAIESTAGFCIWLPPYASWRDDTPVPACSASPRGKIHAFYPSIVQAAPTLHQFLSRGFARTPQGGRRGVGCRRGMMSASSEWQLPSASESSVLPPLRGHPFYANLVSTLGQGSTSNPFPSACFRPW